MKDTYICFIETIAKLWRLFRAEKTHHGRRTTHVVDLEEDNSEQIRREIHHLRWKKEGFFVENIHPGIFDPIFKAPCMVYLRAFAWFFVAN